LDAVSPTIFFIDGSRNTGLQSQIRETTVSAVLSGGVLPGARMPSTRRLADYLKVSRLTVTLAYQELVSQGYLEVRSRSAYHVATTPPISRPDRDFLQTPDTAVDWSSKLRPGFNIAKTIRKPLDWRKYRYPFLYGQMDQTFSIWPHGAIAPGVPWLGRTSSLWPVILLLLTTWNWSTISAHARYRAAEYGPNRTRYWSRWEHRTRFGSSAICFCRDVRMSCARIQGIRISARRFI